MECPNCTFQNMPGMRACVRCQGLLDLSGVAITPPRARSPRALRRVARAVRLAGIGVRDAFSDAGEALRIPSMRGVRWKDIGWSVLPGLGHIRLGQQALGWLILTAWCCCLLVAALGLGSTLSLLLCFGAVSIHSLTISLLLAEIIQQMPLFRRLLFGLGLYWTIFVILYYPAYLAMSSCVHVLAVEGVRKSPSIDNGDVLLYSGRWTRPRHWERGDLVVFQIPAASMPGAYVRSGVGVDRIVGLPGDHVVLRKGTILVNDVPLPRELYPIGDVTRMVDLELFALEDEYIVLPTALQWTTQGNVAQYVNNLITRVSVIHEPSITGLVIGRLRPWSRAGWSLEAK